MSSLNPTTQHRENMNQVTTIAGPKPHGFHAVRTAYQNGLLSLTILHVDHRWMPFCLFGRAIKTDVLRIAPTTALSRISIENTPVGLFSVIENACESETSEASVLASVNESKLQAKHVCILGKDWDSSLRNAAHQQILKELHSTGPTLRFAKLGALFLAGYFIFSIIGAGFNHDHPHPHEEDVAIAANSTVPGNGLTTPQVTPELSSAPVAQMALEKEGATLPVKDAIAQALKMPIRSAANGGKTLIVWSDPLCSNCRDFEENVIKMLPKDLGITMIPVAFKQGSRPLAAYSVCGGSDTANAGRWTAMMSSTPTGDFADVCESGFTSADRNTISFARAGLTSTPTLMVGDRIYTGDLTSVSAVEAWIRQ